jgi:hypothetical protein
MVLEAGWRTMDTVEEGLKATLRLVTDPELDNVTGEYFDGLDLAEPTLKLTTSKCNSGWQRLPNSCF